MIRLSVDLLVDALILILHTDEAEARQLVQRLLEIYQLEERTSNVTEDDFCRLYINLIQEAIATDLKLDDKTAVDAFTLKFKSMPAVVKDPELYSSLKKVFNDATPFTPERKKYIERKLTNALVWYTNTKFVKQMFGKLAMTPNDPDMQAHVLKEISELCNSVIQNNELSSHEEDDDTQVRYLDFQNKDNLKKALTVYNTVSVTNKFVTGLQAMNRALGGGYPLGSSIVLNARSHNAKTLMLLKFARWQVTLNRPSAEFHNPTCLFYSLENETPQNLVLLYRDLYIQRFKKEPPLQPNEDEVVNFCYDEFSRYGWKLVIDRRLGAEFGFAELVANFEGYKRLGFTPLMCIIDYANMMAKGTGDSSESSTNNLQIKELYTNICNYLKSQNCTFVTAHQLNRKADEAVSQNPIGAVRRFGPAMLADSISVQREVDIVFYQNKELDSAGNAYLTFKLDKNRYCGTTPDKDKYFAYPFFGPLGIVDDIDGRDQSCTNIHAYPYQDRMTEIIAQGDPELAQQLVAKRKQEEQDGGDVNLFG